MNYDKIKELCLKYDYFEFSQNTFGFSIRIKPISQVMAQFPKQYAVELIGEKCEIYEFTQLQKFAYGSLIEYVITSLCTRTIETTDVNVCIISKILEHVNQQIENHLTQYKKYRQEMLMENANEDFT